MGHSRHRKLRLSGETAYAVAAYVATAPAATRTDGVAGIETRSWKTDIDRLPACAASCPAYTTRMHVSVCGYRNDCLRRCIV